MTSSPSTARVIDFPCEHTPSKSRVMALLAHEIRPQLAHRRPDLQETRPRLRGGGHSAPRSGRRDASTADDELRALMAEMPDVPASSLRQAVAQAASGAWQAGAGGLFEVPDPDPCEDEPAADALPGPAGPGSRG